jgi:hypothetical protein
MNGLPTDPKLVKSLWTFRVIGRFALMKIELNRLFHHEQIALIIDVLMFELNYYAKAPLMCTVASPLVNFSLIFAS